MSLYYDAVSVLNGGDTKGSLKSRVFAFNRPKPRQAQIYALISETAKYDTFLKDVIDRSGILAHEPKLTPLLSLFLVHDHLLASRGIAAAASHPLRQAVEKHKARLQAEFTKARLRKKCATVESLKNAVNAETSIKSGYRPRWIRVNTLRNPNRFVDNVLPNFTQLASMADLTNNSHVDGYFVDQHVSSLLAFHIDQDLTRSKSYLQGDLIIQDKASCFPAYLLLGEQTASQISDVLDACAAPGNKTTHAAALLAQIDADGKLYACEKDAMRSKTLQSMVTKAGADDRISIRAKQDFLDLNPYDPKFANVTHLLLDPSCSGSGIVGREDIPRFALPEDVRKAKSSVETNGAVSSKKRKRDAVSATKIQEQHTQEVYEAEEEVAEEVSKTRLEKLSNLQTRIIQHAMHLPAARRITYSTCSIHREENEEVVSRVLQSEVARTRKWRILRRDEQVDGMKRWKHRGVASSETTRTSSADLTKDELDACIRCYPGDDEGTMGFFVCGFLRVDSISSEQGCTIGKHESRTPASDIDVEEWEGFSDA